MADLLKEMILTVLHRTDELARIHDPAVAHALAVEELRWRKDLIVRVLARLERARTPGYAAADAGFERIH